MKCAKLRRRQCSMMAVMVRLAAAVLFGVAANAAPREAEGTVRQTGESGTEVTRLVTGDPAQINAVVAGSPPTAILAVNPVPVPAGVTPPNPYPPGTVIIGNELRAEVGGFRAWFHVQVSNWDPNGDGPNAQAYNVKVDCTNYQGVNAVPPNPGVDLGLAVAACFNSQDCRRAFGESWAPNCSGGFCDARYLDLDGTGRPDSWCAPEGCSGYEVCGIVGCNICNYDYFGVSKALIGTPDRGIVYYGGTLVLDIPAGAKGKYSVNLNTDETYIVAPGNPPFNIPTLAETGFVVNIGTGQCCYGLGTLAEGCVDDVLQSECDAEPGLAVYTSDERCPPDGPDCGRFLGACCDTLSGECLNKIVETDCQGTHRVWTSGASCGEAACIVDTGACCDHDPFGPCTDDTVLYDCRCATCTWHKLQTCSEIECVPTPIPTVSEWSLAILTLLLLTAAKVYFGRRGMMHGDMLFPLRRMERAESTDGP